MALSFQLSNQFEVIGVLSDYLPSDHESLGYAAHLVWRNPSFSDHPEIRKAQLSGDLPLAVRVATVQYQQRRIKTFEEFATQIEYFVDIAAEGIALPAEVSVDTMLETGFNLYDRISAGPLTVSPW
ncbi:hypothetical protein [Phaeobacter italicus]|uniref:hypothetical protein n=1 Tax=Phaeobacter italicus TaxID=481446 RepID=UPI00248DDA06|nr:hypothetical protein [Phaeobacter italicus]